MDVKRFMFLWKDFKAKVEDEDEDEEEIKSAFRAYDINGDGYITKDEMVQVRSSAIQSPKIWLVRGLVKFVPAR